MAKQNFLGGGYIGKLGQTVGQRWKDKKVVRTYVKPANPNTPAQQAARSMFATANKLAQEAMNINGHTGAWDTSTCPEYSQRVGQAMKRLRAGYTEQQSLPLYPEGSLPEVAMSLQNYVYDVDNQTVTFTINDYGISEPSAVEISFYSPLAFSDGKYTEHIIHGTVDYNAKTFTVDISNNNTTDDATVRNAFIEYLEFGFLSMYPTFYDNLGAPLQEIRLSRAYAINNTLFDFNKELPIVATQRRVVFTQEIQNGNIEAQVLPPVDNDYPFIVKGFSENTYWGGIAGNESESGFGRVETTTGGQLTFEASQNARYLKTTDSDIYYLHYGDASKQIYRDVTHREYDNPSNVVTVNNVFFGDDGRVLDFYIDDPSKISADHTIKYEISAINSWERNDDLITANGTFTKKTDTIYTTQQGFTNYPESALILYAYIYAELPDGTKDAYLEFVMGDINTTSIKSVSAIPERRDRDLTIDKCPIDIARTQGINFLNNPMVGAGNEIFVTVSLVNPDGSISDPHRYDMPTAQPATNQPLTATTATTNNTCNEMIVGVVEMYTQNGQRKVAFNQTRVQTQTEFIGTTEFTPDAPDTLSVQFEPFVSKMAQSASGTLSYVYDVEWGEWAYLPEVNLTANSQYSGTIDWDGYDPDTGLWFIMEPKFTLKDKNGVEITDIYVSARTKDVNSTIYVNSHLTQNHTILTGGSFVSSTADTVTIRYEPAGLFSGTARVNDSSEITEDLDGNTLCFIDSPIAEIVDSSTLRYQASNIHPQAVGTGTGETPTSMVTGTGYNLRVFTWY